MSDLRQVGLTAAKIAEIRANADDDVFYFARVICGHRDLVRVDHAPLMYAAAGDAEKFVALLTNPRYDSFAIRNARAECYRLDVDVYAADAVAKVANILRVVDNRLYRGGGKSSSITHPVRLWKMCRWPDMSSVLFTNTEPKAVDFCKQIRATILSPWFAKIYPDRVPADTKATLSESRLTLAGRTVSDKEPCLMVFGYKQAPTGYHFDELHFDDLVGRENKSPVEIADVRDFLSNVAALYNPGIRFPIRRIHVGTRWDEQDDAAYVRQYPKCFSLTVPIWHRSTPSEDLTTPGEPTTKWKGLEAIQNLQAEILSNPEEGALSWRCNFELDPAIAGGRLFTSETVRDPFRQYARIAHPDKPERFLVARYLRKDGALVLREKWDGAEDDPRRYQRVVFDPWRDLDRVLTVDPSWALGGDNWAVSCTGDDHQGVRFHLETRSGTDGLEGWVEALLDMAAIWSPRSIGFDGNANQEATIQNMLKLDRRLLRIRGKMVPVKAKNTSKKARIRNFVAEPFNGYRLLLPPTIDNPAVKDYGARAVRGEMVNYKGDPKAVDGILDSLAMAQAVHVRQSSEEEMKQRMAALQRRNAMLDRALDPYTGVAYVAA